jgi:hypothetical protein
VNPPHCIICRRKILPTEAMCHRCKLCLTKQLRKDGTPYGIVRWTANRVRMIAKRANSAP